MAPSRAYWTGNLRLSLVSIPVRLYAATKSAAKIQLHQIHEPSGQRIRYEKTVPGIGPIDSDDIIKGYEFEKGSYVLLKPEEIDKLKLETKQTITLVQFVQQHEIDPLYFERPYYLAPDDDDAEEGFRVIRDALRETKRVALGQLAMRGRENLVAIKPCGRGLLLETLRYADEVREANDIFASIGDEESPGEMLDLARELIERKSAPFDAGAFRDNYERALQQLIGAKLERSEAVTLDEGGGAQRTGKVIDLMEALKKSISESEKRDGSQASKSPAGSRGGRASRKSRPTATRGPARKKSA